MREFFQRRGKFRPRDADQDGADIQIPEDLWVKCPQCQELVYSKELDRNLSVCPKCDYHFRLRARRRIASLLDPDTFVEWDDEVRPADPLGFVDASGPYDEKVKQSQAKTGEHDALVSGWGTIDGYPVVIAVSDFAFMGASMGSVFGEKLARATERAADQELPLLTVSASGGARMHEGIVSLMQMAKTVAALARLGRTGQPHFALLTDPCYGGVTASYATIADVIMAEPGASIGFAGPRVLEQTIRQKLPDGFQTAEFLLDHGMLDQVVPRAELRPRLSQLLCLYRREDPVSPPRPTEAAQVNGTAVQAAGGASRHDG